MLDNTQKNMGLAHYSNNNNNSQIILSLKLVIF